MNKYEKQFKKIEKKSNTKATIQNIYLDMKILKKWNSIYNDKLKFSNDLFIKVMFCLSETPDEFAEWIKSKIFPKLNISSLIDIFLLELSYQLFEEDKTKQKMLMNSMKKAGLVKEITFDEEKSSYNIVTNHDKKYRVKQAADDKEQAEQCNSWCHHVTEVILRQIADNPVDGIDFSGCCVLYYDLFNNPHYHSYIVRDNDNIVIDPAHNIKTKFEFYTDELNHELLLKEEVSKILVGIDTLKSTDSEFDKSNKVDLLKYVMDKQMKTKC